MPAKPQSENQKITEQAAEVQVVDVRYHRRQENLTLLEEINAAHGDTPDAENEKALKASQKTFVKVIDKW